jgi:hypothetical protein
MEAYVSLRREAVYKILIEFRVSRELVRFIKMCMHEVSCRFYVGFPVHNELREANSLFPLVLHFGLERGSQPIAH